MLFTIYGMGVPKPHSQGASLFVAHGRGEDLQHIFHEGANVTSILAGGAPRARSIILDSFLFEVSFLVVDFDRLGCPRVRVPAVKFSQNAGGAFFALHQARVVVLLWELRSPLLQIGLIEPA